MTERRLVPEFGGKIGRGVFPQMREDTGLASPEVLLEPAVNAGDRYGAVPAHGNAPGIVDVSPRRVIQIGIERLTGSGFLPEVRAADRRAVYRIMHARIFESRAQNRILDLVEREFVTFDDDALRAPRAGEGFEIEEACARAFDVADRLHRISVEDNPEGHCIIEIGPVGKRIVPRHRGWFLGNHGIDDLAKFGAIGLRGLPFTVSDRSEEHTSELQSLTNIVCRL